MKKTKSKDFIIECAFVLFLEKGYKEVTLNNIIEATNLSKGAIYHHFRSKEEIYLETLSIYYFNLFENNKLDLSSGSFRDNVKTLYTFVAKMFGDIENIHKSKISYAIRIFFSFQLESEQNEELREGASKIIIEQRNQIEKFVLKAKENGQIRNDIDVRAIVLQIIGMIEGIAVHYSTIKENVKEGLLKKYDFAFNEYFKLVCID